MPLFSCFIPLCSNTNYDDYTQLGNCDQTVPKISRNLNLKENLNQNCHDAFFSRYIEPSINSLLANLKIRYFLICCLFSNKDEAREARRKAKIFFRKGADNKEESKIVFPTKNLEKASI
jgi:hypothetical protein